MTAAPLPLRLRRWFRPRCLAGFAAFLSALLAAQAIASGWSVRTWQMEDGLPNNTVVGVAQTSDGYLWVSTRATLARFDGVQFENIPELLGSNSSGRALFVDSRGTLWLARDPGELVRVQAGKAELILPPKGVSEFIALTMAEDGDGAIWITGRGGLVARVRNRGMVFFDEKDGLPPEKIDASIAKDADGRMWVAKAGELRVWNGSRFEIVCQLPGRGSPRLAGSRRGGLWICVGLRLFRLEADRSLRDLGVFETSSGYGNPTTLLEGDKGAVWMGTSTGGLFRYDGSRFERISIPNERVLTLLQDRERNLWVGTDGGLNRVRPRLVELETIDTGSRSEAIQSLCEDSRGRLWGTTHGGALAVRNENSWSIPFSSATWPGGAATSVAAGRDGAVWIGTNLSSLHCLREGRFSTWSKLEGMDLQTIHALLVSSRGDVWIAGRDPDGVRRLRDGRISSFHLPAETSHIETMVEDAAGNIWIGARYGVLLRITDDVVVDETSRTLPLRKSIRTLYATPDGSVWIGYSGGGLGRWKKGQFTRLLPEQGLPEPTISQMVADDRGWFWLGGDFGLFKVRREELDAVADGERPQLHAIRYGKSELLPNLRARFGTSPGALRTRDGRLWMPMRTALAVINPERVPEELEPPAVLLKRVVVDDRTIALSHGIMPAPELVDPQKSSEPLRLSAGHRRVEFAFGALRCAAPENVSYRYQLIGFDDGWMDVEAERKAVYSRLPAGSYRFHVKAGNGDGVWNDTGATVAFAVAPFLWQTWWARTGALLLFTSLVIALARYVSFRRLHTRLQIVEQQATLDRERARIARDLHDDLGCGLTQVALMLDMTRRDAASPDQQNRQIDQCSSMVRQVAKSVDEIVWAVNPRNDTVRYLIDYTSQFAVEFLHAAALRCRIQLPDSPPDATVSPEARHNLFLVVKEALNNITRHAHASEVHVQITTTDDEVVFVIADDGQGFDRAPDNSQSDGLRNMRQRIDEIGGRFEIESERGAGTRITFSYSWSPRH